MRVHLIPVLELLYSTGTVLMPDCGPYWLHPDDWAAYRAKCLLAHGFSADLKPFAFGDSYYHPEALSDADLLRHLSAHCAEGRQLGGDWQQVCPLFGGYVLRVDGTNAFFPQCCSDLSDIQSWRRIATGADSYLHEGHPSPVITFDQGKALFDFSDEAADGEAFTPPPAYSSVSIPLEALVKAVRATESELQVLAERLERLNMEYQLQIPDISSLLIYGQSGS